MCFKTVSLSEPKQSKDKHVKELFPNAFTPCLNRYAAVDTVCDKKWAYLWRPALKMFSYMYHV